MKQPPQPGASHGLVTLGREELAALWRSGDTWRLRLGDWGVLATVLALIAVSLAWRPAGGSAEKVRIRAGASVYAEFDPKLTRRLEVPGPLGTTVVEIAQGRARIASDPSPRQICVQKAWLSAAGEHALCLPNQVSVELIGHERRHDTLAY
ncbi:hypothetical protein BURK2_03657 [Burkholderiales bacterium]|nr:MAG: NusG domain II-containing protein [Burkholderiales bacterium]CAG1007861.1 hypothetical protein BURK2_03657 [Burkholderiales bacterium]